MTKKIMLVDDVFTANFIMKKMIQKVAPGYFVTDFILSELAIESIEENNPDLIFLDLNMPVVNGWKFLDLMKEKNLENKVYILTSSNSQFDKEQSEQYKNVVGFLVKPIKLSAILELFKVID